MKDSKLITLLSALTKKEIDDFSFFLNSPLFNDRTNIIHFYKEIIKHYPGFSSADFTKENIFKSLNPGKKYNDEFIRNLSSRLHRALEKYLSFIGSRNDWFNQQFYLLNELSARGQGKLFEKKFESIAHNLDELPFIDTEKFFQLNRLTMISSRHYFAFKKTHDTDKQILEDRAEKITDYFIADILNVYTMMANQMLMYPERNYKFPMIESISEYIEQNKNRKDVFYLRMLLYEVLLLKENDAKYLDELKIILNENSSRLLRTEKEKTYSLLINYLQDRIFKGDSNAQLQRHEIQKEMFINQAFDEGELNPALLINAVSWSLTLHKIEDAEFFIKNYIKEVNDYYRESTKYYCMALVNFYNNDYNLTLQNLSKVTYDDISYKLLIRTLMLMTYYCMNDVDGFYSLSDSFHHFLDVNKKINPYYYDLYTNFINFTSKLFKAKDGFDNFDFNNFKKELNETAYLAKKQWLLEMTDNLEKEKSRS